MNKKFGNTIIKVFFAALLLSSSAAMAQVQVGGNVFGGGKKANVGGNSTVLIDQNGAIVGTISEGALVENTGDVYGGGEEAKVNVTATTTNNITSYSHTSGTSTNVTLRVGTVRGNLYGGGLGVRPTSDEDPGTPADVFGPVQVTINGGTVGGSVFGCNNLYGAPQSTVIVDVVKDPSNVLMSIGNVYGGGNQAAYGGTPDVNIISGKVVGNVYGGGNDILDDSDDTPQGVVGTDVEMTGGEVNGSIYGGCNVKGTVTTNSEVKIKGGVVGVATVQANDTTEGVYGGGLGANTKVKGNVTVTIDSIWHQTPPVIYGDVYGGSALGSVNDENTDKTTVNIYDCTISRRQKSGTSPYTGADTIFYYGGSIYGGGLGDLNDATKGQVNGVVTVNIGDTLSSIGQLRGKATIEGSVFGCNNTNGTPKDNVTVNIFQTAHDDKNVANYHHNDSTFAIYQVFGGGNKAHYQPVANKKTTVHVWTCENTIEYLYGGGNAADVGNSTTNSADTVIIDGGRFGWVFGGGNGAGVGNPGANIYGDASVTYHAGDIIYLFGGSNEKGNISGVKKVDILSDGQCVYDNRIAELYGGNNLAPAVGDVTLTMDCPDAGSYPCTINYLFGGSRKANITGNVVLTVNGGLYDYVFGGNNEDGIITGDVTLNLFGGTINEAAFGGNNLGGAIKGKITVNMLEQGPCPLIVHNIYGGGNLAAYSPTTTGVYPEVNLIHGTVSKKSDNTGGNVYGGGLGNTATVTSSPKVTIGYDASMATLVSTLLLSGSTLTASNDTIEGNVYGGGEEAPVVGSTSITIQRANNTDSFTSYVGNDVYGGGNLANVSGSTTVNVTGGTVTHDVYGGGALANVGTDQNDNTTVTLAGGSVRDIYGGGLGDATHPAAVKGAVQVTVNDGTVRDVFGCNNVKGAPESTVQVNINNNVTRNVYGGGNQAGCSVSPVVYINKGTVGGSVFGGGLGATATVAGQPSVTVGDLTEGHSLYQAIVTGDVYGGGDMAKVKGKTTVLVQKCNTEIHGDVYGGGNAADILKDDAQANGTTSVKVTGGTISSAVYGGGHGNKDATPDPISANVEGSTNVEINGGTINQVYGGSNSMGTIYDGIPGGISVKVNKANDACELHIRELYGGGNYAASQAGSIDIQCTGTVANANEGITYVYGGANRADVTGPIVLTIAEGRIDTVFGGNNNSGVITGDITVNIDKKASPCVWEVGDVFGGGNIADYSGTPKVNIKNGTITNKVFGGGNMAGVGGGDVAMTGGTILGGLYGGCNLQGTVTGDINVTVSSGVIGTRATIEGDGSTDIFGGGYGEQTRTNGHVTVTIDSLANHPVPVIYGDVYGGSAFGWVNSDNNDTTTVNIYYGIFDSKTDTITIYAQPTTHQDSIGYYVVYHGGNIYGGGLGDKNTLGQGHTNVEAKEYGVVIVNIGAIVQVNGVNDTIGNATIGGTVYGCNNVNGSPQDSVYVNVYQTAHTPTNLYNYTPSAGDPPITYAIANVFGGGNEADYTVSGGKVSVNIIGCENTIRRVFGGGNAAEVYHASTEINGGRFAEVYGGGNGERGTNYAANILGNVNLGMHGGSVGQFYVGSNQHGVISGTSTVAVDNTGCAGQVDVEEFFCGGNFADFVGNIDATITCSGGMHVKNLYGGCNQANVVAGDLSQNATLVGNVTLTVWGGEYDNIYGGSKGRPDDDPLGPMSANIDGSVTLNIYGGTVHNAIYGGCNVKGKVYGNITVNVIDSIGDDCDLEVSLADVYGGGNMAEYHPGDIPEGHAGLTYTIHDVNPQVNIQHATVKNVYGGGLGSTATVTANPKVTIGDDYAPHRAVVRENVYGGGNAAKVLGNTEIILKSRSKVNGNVYGGGNMGEVVGNTKVIVNGPN